jgi:hypothetical protein
MTPHTSSGTPSRVQTPQSSLPATCEGLLPWIKLSPAIYLFGMAVFWLSALPAYFGAHNGITSAGTPIGSGPYALACFVGAGLLLAAQHATRPVRVITPAAG